MKENAVMVVGGYGTVGRHIVTHLAQQQRVIIAGRTLACVLNAISCRCLPATTAYTQSQMLAPAPF